MRPPQNIIGLTRRVSQGITRPFYCRVDGGGQFYVKSTISAGHASLCKEWLAARIAQAMELPIPSFAQLMVSPLLSREALSEDQRELGGGLVFGSCEIPFAQCIQSTRELRNISGELKRRILLFDWWIQNADRTLTGSGGNPNLLWHAKDKEVFVMDHNNAFEDRFDVAGFWSTHVFRAAKSSWDMAFKEKMSHQMHSICQHVSSVWDECPEAWRFLDDDCSIPIAFCRADVVRILTRFQTNPLAFWGVSP